MRLSSRATLLSLIVWAVGCDAKKTTLSPVDRSTGGVPAGQNEKVSPVPKAPVEPVKHKVDFTITPKELLTEFNANAKKCKTKYEGKWVDVEGVLYSMTLIPDFLGCSFFLDDANIDASLNVLFDQTLRDRFESLKALSRNQKMTVRGRVSIDERAKFIQILDSELVKVGPNPAQPATVKALIAEFATPEGKKKLTEVVQDDVVLRVEVRVNSKTKDGLPQMVIGDPGKTEPTLKVGLAIVGAAEAKRWGEIKPGTAIILMGAKGFTFESGRQVPQLNDARVLTSPPEGVALPPG